MSYKEFYVLTNAYTFSGKDLWPGDYFDGVFGDEIALWFARPLKMVDIELHGLIVIVIKGCLSVGFSGFQLCCMLFSDAAHGVGGHLMGCDEQGAFMIGHNLDFDLIVALFFFDALAYQIGIGRLGRGGLIEDRRRWSERGGWNGRAVVSSSGS